MKHVASGFFLDRERQQILLHLRDGNTKNNPHKWAFFGGLIEGEETPEEGFIREIQEELGIDVKKGEACFLREYFNEPHNTHKSVFYVERYVDPKEIILGEGADFRWIPLDEVLGYDMTDTTRDDLEFLFGKLD